MPSIRHHTDPEDAELALLFRDRVPVAAGHMCSAQWTKRDAETEISTCWLPTIELAPTSPLGHKTLSTLGVGTNRNPLSASWLAEASPQALKSELSQVSRLYDAWIDEQEGRIKSLATGLQPAARRNLERCGLHQAESRTG